ncbi:MAG: hypothetical protein ACKV2V_14035, partial [Blastocatellia bacterium]
MSDHKSQSRIQAIFRPLCQPQFWRNAVVYTLIAIFALPAPMLPVGAQQPSPLSRREAIKGVQLDVLRNISSALRSVIEGWKIKQLIEIVDNAQEQFDQQDPCAAARTMEKALELLRETSAEKHDEALADAYNRLATFRQDLLDA